MLDIIYKISFQGGLETSLGLSPRGGSALDQGQYIEFHFLWKRILWHWHSKKWLFPGESWTFLRWRTMTRWSRRRRAEMWWAPYMLMLICWFSNWRYQGDGGRVGSDSTASEIPKGLRASKQTFDLTSFRRSFAGSVFNIFDCQDLENSPGIRASSNFQLWSVPPCIL